MLGDEQRIEAVKDLVRRRMGLGRRHEPMLEWWTTIVLAIGDADREISAANVPAAPAAPQPPAPARVLRRPQRVDEGRVLGPAWKTNREA